VGVVAISIFVTFLLYYYHQWFIDKPKTAGVIGTYVTLAMSSKYLSEININTTLLTFGLGSSFLIYMILKDKDLKFTTSNIPKSSSNDIIG
jgi:hypothetical protein